MCKFYNDLQLKIVENKDVVTDSDPLVVSSLRVLCDEDPCGVLHGDYKFST